MSGSAIRYALVGAGSAARVHLRDIARQPGVVLVGIADPLPPAAWKLSEPETTPRFANAAEMLRATTPDLVSVCTPNKFHCEIALAALRAGAHVVCEKPMAMTVREAETMEHERCSRGLVGTVNFSYRNTPSFRYARRMLEDNALGPLTRVAAAYLQSFRLLPGTGRGWRGDAALAGFGALADLGVHMIDAVRFLTGCEFIRVVGHASTLTEQSGHRAMGAGAARRATETHAAFLGELSGDVTATLETTQVAAGYGDYFRIEISGHKGTLTVSSEQPETIWLHTGQPSSDSVWKTDIPARPVPAEFTGRHAPRSPAVVVEALRGVRVEYPSFRDGVAAQRVLGALAESISRGAWAAVH